MNVQLDHRIVIEYKSVTQDAAYGTEVITWTLLAVIWAEVKDINPSRSESVRQGLAMAKNQTRIRFRYRTDVNSAMRVTVRGATDRVMQIVGGPAELGRHEYTEIMCETYSS